MIKEKELDTTFQRVFSNLISDEALQKELSEKHGDGNVNITTGEFTPISK